MAKQTVDPGIGEKFDARSGRVLNQDGTFNVERIGFDIRRLNIFQYLIRITWVKFFFILFIAFMTVNLLFAVIYLLLGDNALKAADVGSGISHFWECVFFSVHTMTTVGYGNLYPNGFGANIISGIEAMLGLLGFAIATGMVYGRFSRPTAKIAYSKHAIVTPFQNHKNAMMFRLANFRHGVMMDIEASALFTYLEKSGDIYIRKYFPLELQRNKVIYLPLSWTLVHTIDENSPLFGREREELQRMNMEIMLNLKGYDETYGDVVHSRYSYLYEDIVWGAKFVPAFHVRDDGVSVLDLDKIGLHEKAEMHPHPPHHTHTLSSN